MANLWRKNNPELAKQKDREYRLARLRDPEYIARRAAIQKKYSSKVASKKAKLMYSCPVCKKDFLFAGKRKYCSAPCQKEAHRKTPAAMKTARANSLLRYHSTTKYERAKVKKCRICGEDFSTFGMRGSAGNVCARLLCKSMSAKLSCKEGRRRRRHRMRDIYKTTACNLTEKQWREALLFFDFKCAYCGNTSTELHQEHVVPVVKGGGYTANNIVPACRSCNSYKRDQWLEVWYDAQTFYSKDRYFRILLFLGTRDR